MTGALKVKGNVMLAVRVQPSIRPLILSVLYVTLSCMSEANVIDKARRCIKGMCPKSSSLAELMNRAPNRSFKLRYYPRLAVSSYLTTVVHVTLCSPLGR